MFEILLWVSAGVVVLGMILALDGSRDVFHPLIFIGPMLIFLYAWMPSQLLADNGLERYFDNDQLVFIQTFYIFGLIAFVVACLSVGVRIKRLPPARKRKFPPHICNRITIGGAASGAVGLLCWLVTIHNVGGFVAAYSRSYSGGWDDSGYVRDGSLLLLVGLLLCVTSLASGGKRTANLLLISIFGLPWLSQALLMARRGPTFAFVAVVLMGWFMARRRRPPLLLMAGAGFLLGWLVLFLVTNRTNIYLGSSFAVSTDVGSIVETPDTGNEYIYGGGAILSAERANHYFWMRRYLAQILVRPIPSSIWPTKYADFGVPELLENAGTGSGFADALGWEGAAGSAPGIIADLWIEVWWFAILAMAALGWLYGYVWKRAVTRGGPWSAQYVVLSALSIYLVMQTMEAVIFRTLLLSIPCWLTWRWALRAHAPTRKIPARRKAVIGSVQRA